MVCTWETTRPGTPPPAPEHFDERYRPPPHREYTLSIKNPHPNDALLRFHEAEHIYVRTQTGVPFSDSCTKVAHQYESPFDEQEAIDKMRASTREKWPRLAYVVDARLVESDEDFCASRGALVVEDGKTTVVVRPHDMDGRSGEEIASVLRNLVQHNDACYYTYAREMSDDEIKASWRRNGEMKRNIGTEAHLQMQLLVEGEPHRMDPEVRAGLQFFERVAPEWHAYRTEYEIFCEDADLAGSVDLLLRHGTTGHIAIIDYKVSEKLADSMHGFGSKRLNAPMNHLDDCDGAKYALQLSIYQYILERDYGLVVDDRVLMGISAQRPFCTSVPYLHHEVDYMMRERMSIVKARASCPYRCAVTDTALYDPVVVSDETQGAKRAGRVMNRKVALLTPGVSVLRDDEETRALVEEHIAKHAEKVQLVKPLKQWRNHMPRVGIVPKIFLCT